MPWAMSGLALQAALYLKGSTAILLPNNKGLKGSEPLSLSIYLLHSYETIVKDFHRSILYGNKWQMTE